MSFIYPLGLLGLIGIPILVLIYIIKSKYSEQTVASTYLWELSERFLKRKRPVSPISGIISLALQVLSVLLISLIVAHPVITVKGSANEYCFVLDASAGMQTVEGGESRFDKAKGEIERIVDSSADGSLFTLIKVGGDAAVVFERVEDKRDVKEYLDMIECSDGEFDVASAIAAAQQKFDSNRGIITYLVTDTAYTSVNNMQVLNVATGATNAAISSAAWDISSGKLTVRASVVSYGEAFSGTVSLYLDGASTPTAVCDVTLEDGVPFGAVLEAPTKSFNSLKLVLSGSDGLAIDNEYAVYDVKSEGTHKILLVSETPFFLETVFAATGNTKITVISPDEYSSSTKGYGLYVFDCCTPSEMPTDGAVWFIDPQGSVPDSGFSVQGDVALQRGEPIKLTTSSSTLARTLTSGVKGEGIELIEYVRCSLYRSFTPVFTYNGNPVLFAGTNGKGHREVVFAFDIHNSNLPMLVDFVILASNLMDFSFPEVIEDTSYTVGDEATVNVIANCDSIRVDSPSGTVTYLNTDAAQSTVSLSECGSYKITVTVSRVPREYYIFAALPEEESDPMPTADAIGLVGDAVPGGFDGKFDPTFILFVALALIFIADWTVYCYEKYQLR